MHFLTRHTRDSRVAGQIDKNEIETRARGLNSRSIARRGTARSSASAVPHIRLLTDRLRRESEFFHRDLELERFITTGCEHGLAACPRKRAAPPRRRHRCLRRRHRPRSKECATIPRAFDTVGSSRTTLSCSMNSYE